MHPKPPSTPLADRRSFLKTATYALGGLFAAVLGIPAVAYLLDPRTRRAPAGDFRTAARLSDLPVGVPRQVVLRDVRRDAWTLYPNDVIGKVWLIRRDAEHVDAYTTICPHLGCSINYDEKKRLFICPCHGGTFTLSGQRVSEQELGHPNPAPRGMDALACRRDPDEPELLQVKYENFIQGRDTPVPKA